jgi:hypothetical protein
VTVTGVVDLLSSKASAWADRERVEGLLIIFLKFNGTFGQPPLRSEVIWSDEVL